MSERPSQTNLRNFPPKPSRVDGKPEPKGEVLAEGRRFWAGLVFVAGLLAAGFGFRDRVAKFFIGMTADQLDHRLERFELDQTYLHHEIRDARQDFRDYTAGKLQPLPSDTPWPSPSPTPAGTGTP